VGWTLPEMVKDVLHSRLVGGPQHGDWRGDGMRMTEGLWRARMRAFLARLPVVLRARHAGGAAAAVGGGGGCDTW